MFHEAPRWPVSTQWTREEDKLFEQALVSFSEELPDRWQRIAGQLPGKSVADVMMHYQDLVHDVREIDSGRVELPSYADDSVGGLEAWDSTNQISFGSKPKHAEPERKKGTPWTEKEHKLFLQGLLQYGKGDWRSISRNVVITRTPTQVASHAQKYYLRQGSGKKERKRSSIHDITTVDSITVPVAADRNSMSMPHPPPRSPPQQLQPFQHMNPPPTHMTNCSNNNNNNLGDPFGFQSFGFPN